MRNFQQDCDEEQREELRRIHRKGCWVVIILSLLVAMACAMSSCKSVKTEVKYNYRDSIITHNTYDTTRVCVRDTIHVESSSGSYKDDELEIQFGSGGGTYNVLTGDATNVSNVKQKSQVKELQNTVTSQAITIDCMSATIDSLRHALNEVQGEEHHEENTKDITPRTGWDRFCTWWTVGSWVVLLLLLVYACWRVYRKYWLHI